MNSIFSRWIIVGLLISLSGVTAGFGFQPVLAQQQAISNGGTVTIGHLEPLNAINPWGPFGVMPPVVNCLWLLTLAWVNSNAQIVPMLAQSWNFSSDLKTVTVHLARNVTWQDGTPVTAEDVKFTLDKVLTEAGNPAKQWGFANLASVDMVDTYTIVLHYSHASLSDFDSLILNVAPVPKSQWANRTWDNMPAPGTLIGDGPFKLMEWQEGQYIKFQAFDNFFLGRPHIDTLIYKDFQSEDDVILALKTGEIDAAVDISPRLIADLSTQSNMHVSVMPGDKIWELSLNVYSDNVTGVPRFPLMQDKSVRKALAYAIDKDSLINMLFLGDAVKADTLIPPWMTPYYDNYTDKYPFNLAAANSVLDAAGYKMSSNGTRVSPDGQPLSFSIYLPNTNPDMVTAFVSFIVPDMQKIGVSLFVTVADEGTVFDRMWGSPPLRDPMYLDYWTFRPDPTIFMRHLISSHLPPNGWDPGFINSTYDQLYALQAQSSNVALRTKYIWEMQSILEDQLPWIPLWYPSAVDAWRTDKFDGFSAMYGGLINRYNSIYGMRSVHLLSNATAAMSVTTTTTQGYTLSYEACAIVLVLVVVAGAYVLLRRRRRRK